MLTTAVSTRCTLAARPAALRAASVSRSSAVLRSRLVVRAAEQEPSVSEPVVSPLAAEPVVTAVPTPAAAPAVAVAAAEPFSLLGGLQESINGRAAMLGFLVAIFSELATKQSVWSQIAGKYVDRDLVEHPIGASTLFFFFIVVMTTFASFAPQVMEGKAPASRSFGPFTPTAELANGRIAMVGFAALLLVELVRGNTALF